MLIANQSFHYFFYYYFDFYSPLFYYSCCCKLNSYRLIWIARPYSYYSVGSSTLLAYPAGSRDACGTEITGMFAFCWPCPCCWLYYKLILIAAANYGSYYSILAKPAALLAWPPMIGLAINLSVRF